MSHAPDHQWWHWWWCSGACMMRGGAHMCKRVRPVMDLLRLHITCCALCVTWKCAVACSACIRPLPDSIAIPLQSEHEQCADKATRVRVGKISVTPSRLHWPTVIIQMMLQLVQVVHQA